MQFPCFVCGGAAHPATGHVYTAAAIVCHRCTIEAWRYVERTTHAKGGRSGVFFYEHVTRKEGQR